MMKKFHALSWATLALMLVGASGAARADAPAPDAHTLFLAHFDQRQPGADYALGLSLFAGNGATLTQGYYGQAIDLRPRGLFPDFVNQCADMTPIYDGWGFHTRGNIAPAQGTFECWFKPADPKAPKLLWSSGFIGTELSRSVRIPEAGNYTGFGITLNTHAIRYFFPTLKGNLFRGDVSIAKVAGKPMGSDEWHHFALTWSQGELVLWLDGRAILSHDMSDQLGLVIASNPTRYLNMSDCIVDELRISNVVRYSDDFEPAWHDGKRPAHALAVTAKVQRFDPKLQPAPTAEPSAGQPGARTADLTFNDWTLTLDTATGSLRGVRWSASDADAAPVAEGLHLHDGLARQPLPPAGLANLRQRFDGAWAFTQRFDADVRAEHLLQRQGQTLRWSVTLINDGQQERRLEPKLGLPATIARVEELFDNVEPRRSLHLPRHRDEYCYALPFTAVSGEGRFVGVGIEPTTDLSDIVSQWTPQPAAIRQGTKIVLSPGERFTLPFVVVQGRSDFATLDAIDAFHSLFPDLYRLWKDTTIYSYMPATQYWPADKFVDMKRQGYAGGFWGHGPGHDKGDEVGSAVFWDNDQFKEDKHYQYTQRIQALWGNLFNVRQYITAYHRESYDNWYPVRRFHTCPDVTPNYIINTLWPGYVPNEDPLTMGQYYRDHWFAAQIVNEFNNPIGAHFREQTRAYFRQTMGYCPGFINDMSHAGSLYRHNDAIAQRAAGRSFARDLGPFIRKAIGRRQRHEVLTGFRDNGSRATFWSDGGSFSYTLCAFSSGIAIEGAGLYKDLTGPAQYVVPARHLLGEKPLTAMTHINDDWIGYYLKPGEFTARTLRDFYRFSERQLVLWCLDKGVTLDPTSYFWGRQYSWEAAPLLVEATTLGRQLVPAAQVSEPLWVRRSGRDLATLLIVGNHQPRAIATDLVMHNRYFAAAPLLSPYYGGELKHEVTPQLTTIREQKVDARDFAAFKAVGLLRTDSTAQVATQLQGDGLALRLSVDLQLQSPATLWPADFAPLYRVTGVSVDGRPAEFSGEPMSLDAGRRRVVLNYQLEALPFDMETWKQVELIRNGQPNFRVVADGGVAFTPDPTLPQHTFLYGFERGTARMLGEFIEAYDDENGQVGDMRGVVITRKLAEGYSGWTVQLGQDPMLAAGRVRIEPSYRTLHVEGPTQGQMRQAMVTLLRLMDRTYPHVGRFHPLRYSKQVYDASKPVPFEKWVVRKPTREFYEAFEDARFWVKPILHERYEPLYDGDNMDFSGKYQMRWPPRLIEPTYGDAFVYGYTGLGSADTQDELLRRPRARKQADAPAPQ
jgi:hypothetical protein